MEERTTTMADNRPETQATPVAPAGGAASVRLSAVSSDLLPPLDNWYFGNASDTSPDAAAAIAEFGVEEGSDIQASRTETGTTLSGDRFSFEADPDTGLIREAREGSFRPATGTESGRTRPSYDNNSETEPFDIAVAPPDGRNLAGETPARDGETAAAAPSASLNAIPIDTLFSEQWHLLNTGQDGGQAGIDINVAGVWDDYTGAGVRVGVVDDGVEYTHHDLNDNYDFSLQYDYGGNDTNPLPSSSDHHGTAVAGLIAAENNGTGTVGVAYDASVTAFRIFGGGVTESEYADVYNRHAAELDVSNNSWGYNGFFYDNLDGAIFDGVGAAIENAAANGRDGLGTVMLWAAGNSRLSGQDVNYHGFQNARETIAVAAIDNTGEISYYSTPGAAILVGSPSNGGTSGIYTTDHIGSIGYSSSDYTGSFGGTSAATPIAAGAVALVLEANPLLGYRDVQEILAYSARQVDTSDPGWTYNDAHTWNGGGLHTSHDFGFGLIDTLAAVRLAETWTEQSTAANEVSVSASSAPSKAILDNSTITDTVFIGGGIDIQHVEVDINILHTWIGDLTVTLTAPDGTQSVLVDRPGVSGSSTFGTSQDNIDFTLSSTNHWGETGAGTWTLSVNDAVSGDAGTLVDWTLTLYGDAVDNDDTYIYTNEFAAFAGNSARQTLSDTTGLDAINAAAITSDSLIDLNAGASSLLAGTSLDIAAGTVIENAFAGDGADTLIGNEAANMLSGGRGDDVLIGGAAGDTMDGGTGSDTVSYAGSTSWLYARLDTGAGYAGDAEGDRFIGVENLTGGTGGNMLYGDMNANVITGGDNVTGTNALYGHGGDDTIHGGSGHDYIRGDDGDDVLNGNGSFDEIWGGAGNDQLFGGDGNDNLVGGAGGDTMDGGNGSDTVSYAGSTSWLYARLDTGHGYAGDAEGDSFTGVENLTGGTGGNMLYGDMNANVITGGDNVTGTNALYGHGGDDTIHGGSGHDYMRGDDGDDVLNGNGSYDEIWGGAGNDQLFGGDGNDNLVGGAGGDLMDGGNGFDTVSYAGSTSWLYARLDTGHGYAGDADGDVFIGVENLIGGTGGNMLYGNANANVITGGDNVSGTNALYGHNGDDTIHGGSGHDYVLGGDGDDIVNGNGGYDELHGGTGNDRIDGGAGDDNLFGDAGDDVFIFRNGDGSDRIQDFAAGAGSDDRLDFSGVSALNDLTDVQSAATQTGFDLAIDFGGGEGLTLIGVQLSSLHEDDFIF